MSVGQFGGVVVRRSIPISPVMRRAFPLLLVTGTFLFSAGDLVAQAAPLLVPCVPSASESCTAAATLEPQTKLVQPQKSSTSSSSELYLDRSGSEAPPATTRDHVTPELPDPVTDFQRLAQASTGELLPIFGRDFFQSVPSTFAPGDQLAVSPDYVVGPGDDILLRIWGPEVFNGQLTVDRSGAVYLPKVGAIHVAGLRFDELQRQINTELSRTYRNFETSVNLGKLRSVQVYVVGEAKHPGAYTVSSLSTVLNALFASGGPNVQGSLRHIQVRRNGQAALQFDLYDFILHGDKSRDVRLEPGDTIFIPPVGQQVAIAGSVHHPAIYELAIESNLHEIMTLAGGFTPTASTQQVSLERIRDDRARNALNVSLDAAGLKMPLRDGDVIFVNHITAGYAKTVSIRGNLANPGRFPWHEGMKLSEIIPDKMSLLSPDYWDQRNRLGVPVPLFQRSTPPAPATEAGAGKPSGTVSTPIASAAGGQQNTSGSEAVDRRNLIKVPAPEIDWSYAVIERLDSRNLKNTLVPFNLGRLVQDHDPTQDLELLAGDTVTILSQNDVQVAQEMRTKYVRLEGEFAASGVYSVGPNETLADLVQRSGGLTSSAYLYGSSFSRESARVFQQQRLDDYIASLSADMERAVASESVSATAANPTSLSEQRLLIDQLRQLRATGRIVLEFTPQSTGAGALPPISLEDGDVFRVPSIPSTVSVVGAVYGQNVFLYSPQRRLVDYVALAGKPNRIADRKHAFIIRADGSVFSRERAQGTLSNNFDSTKINPGDSIVIPEKLIKPPFIRSLVEYSQILSGFGLAAGAINILR